MAKSFHLNQEAYILENDELKVCVLKNFGAKIASITHKKTDFEFLFQPSLKKYQLPIPNGDFADFDTSGLDDTIPTIDTCNYPGTTDLLPDHGDVWSREWEFSLRGSLLNASIQLVSVPLLFERGMELRDNRLVLSYSLTNNTGKGYHYLWALHGLNRIEENTRLLFLKREVDIMNVKDDRIFDFDWRNLYEFPDKSSYKFYMSKELSTDKVGLYYPSKQLSYIIHFNPSELPYLGVWFTKGGFKGEYNCALEPCNGFYDSLERCVENGKSAFIEPFSQKTWKVEIEIRDDVEGDC
ncbi:MAG: hypothetical protein Q3993_04330 [Filifactor alocis]|nr:hypothetical protein [Filifactor alocis]